MKGSVIVVADKNGNVIVQNSNPDYGYIQLIQDRMEVNSKGWLDTKTFSCLLKGLVSDLKKLRYSAGQELQGNIIINESLCPFNKVDPKKNLKIAPSTGEVFHTKRGEPIYRDTFWDPTGCKDDVLIQFDSRQTKTLKTLIKVKEVKKDKPVNEQIELFDDASLEEQELAEEIQVSTEADQDTNGVDIGEPEDSFILTNENFNQIFEEEEEEVEEDSFDAEVLAVEFEEEEGE